MLKFAQKRTFYIEHVTKINTEPTSQEYSHAVNLLYKYEVAKLGTAASGNFLSGKRERERQTDRQTDREKERDNET
jgi:hypothetical protein